MPARYAIFYAPEADSELANFGNEWLSDQSPYTEFTTFPRHYGFHGTLKAPISLKNAGQPPTDIAALQTALETFANQQSAFDFPTLEVSQIGDKKPFFALRPIVASEALKQLATDCVREFDHFRAPVSAADLVKRPDDGLSERQRELRQQWGYPYVLDEFRFHMTLTNAIEDAAQSQRLMGVLQETFASITQPKTCNSICLFSQSDRDTPFQLQQRFYFGAN